MSQSTFILQQTLGRLCAALQQIRDGVADPAEVAARALASKTGAEQPTPEQVFDRLNPEGYAIRKFPHDDCGESEGDDLLAECIVYGFDGSDNFGERQILFGIKLGRELEKNGL
jgi:hypothetical protein